MSIKAAVLMAVSSHHNQNSHGNNSNSNNNAVVSLTSGIAAHFNASDLYSTTNFNNHTTSKNFNNQGLRVMRPGGGFHGNVNILLGGAMLSVVTTIVCLICYCCHRKIKMRSSTSSLYRQQRWIENESNMEIYSVEQYFDTSGLYSEGDNLPPMPAVHHHHHHTEPPPSYDCVMALDEVISRKRKNLYTFKGMHNAGPDIKDCNSNANGNMTPSPTTPQVSLDETNCDIRSPSSGISLCNCCTINQITFLPVPSNDAAAAVITENQNQCNTCITTINNSTDDTNNNVTCLTTLITAGNSNCPLNDIRNRSEIDLLNDRLNNNSSCMTMVVANDNIASPSTSDATCHHSSVALLKGELMRSHQNDNEDDEDEDDDINGNTTCRQPRVATINLETISRNGLIRLDMSQIIDQTGLPTYEAALKLKSSGYV